MYLSEIFPAPVPSIGVGTALRNTEGKTFLLVDGGNAVGLVSMDSGETLKPVITPTSKTKFTREEVLKLISKSGHPELAEWETMTLRLNE